jgi:hypothetical protein
MSLAATIVFTGIVLIQQKGTGDLTAYLPDETKPKMSMNKVPSNGKNFTIPPHAAYVKVKDSQVYNTSRKADLQFVQMGELMDVYFLQNDEKIEVQSDSTDPIKGATSPMTGRDLFSVVIPSTLLNGTAKLKSGAALTNALAGHVVLKHGTIYATDNNSDDWTFKHIPNKTFHLPQSVTVEMGVTLNQVDLLSTTSAQSIHLSDHPDANHPIQVEFGNGTILSILAACPPISISARPAICDEGEDDGFDFHYELFNDVLDSYLVNGKPPIPLATVVHHVTGSNCPPQRIE